MSLYVTPTRLDLLIAVHEGRVVEGMEDNHTWLCEDGYQPRKVDARIEEAQRAAWVQLPGDGVCWALTAAGREAMAEGLARKAAPVEPDLTDDDFPLYAPRRDFR